MQTGTSQIVMVALRVVIRYRTGKELRSGTLVGKAEIFRVLETQIEEAWVTAQVALEIEQA